MSRWAAERVARLPEYAFSKVRAAVAQLREAGADPIDFGIGDPTDPTPAFIRQACQLAVEDHARSGYPGYLGSLAFREAVAAWTERRFGVRLDPATEISSTIGAKEAVAHFALAVVDPGDLVLCPSPGYPPYVRGTQFAGGEAYPYGLFPEDGFLPELSEVIPPEVARKAKAVWLCYPNAPTGAVASRAYLERQINWARDHDILVLSDEPYTELYFTDEPPPSALEIAREGVLVFQSLSKRSAMTGYRVGWVAGDPRLVELLRTIKKNVDTGTPRFMQDAAIAALSDESHVAAFRAVYRERRDALCGALAAAGFPRSVPDGAIYLWQRLPEGRSAEAVAERLLEPDTAIVCTPGPWLCAPLPDGRNPGEGFLRFALVPSLQDHLEAARRIRRALG